MIEIQDKAQFDLYIRNGYTVVEFGATWCGSCKMLLNSMATAEKEFENNSQLKFAKVDVEKIPDLAAQYAIMSLPYTVVFHNNGVLSDKFGYMPSVDLIEWLNGLVD